LVAGAGFEPATFWL